MDEPTELEHRPRRRGIYLLPNLLTTGSLFAGFYGIIASIDGRYEPAAIAVIIGLRGNATNTAVPTTSEVVALSARAASSNPSWIASGTCSPSNPIASARAA